MGSGHALHIVSEPEAAAVYALDVMDPHVIEIGDTFVLCDAGGGTVDLITYTVIALKPKLEISEVTPGTGSLCGSIFLNRKFEEFLEDRLGRQPGWDRDVLDEVRSIYNASTECPLIAKQAAKRFETVVCCAQNLATLCALTDYSQIKKQFRGTDGEEFKVPGKTSFSQFSSLLGR